MEEFWKPVDEFFNDVYLSIYRSCQGSEFLLNVGIPLFIMLAVYWIASLLFTILDVTGWPPSIVQFKIPDQTPTQYPRVTRERLLHVIVQVLFNQTVVAVPVIYFCYVLKSHWGYDSGTTVPQLPRFIFNMVAQILFEELFFYYSHRLLHYPPIYVRYHKRHHEWKSPIAASAIYCHPVEHVLSNVLPTYAGSVIVGTHVTSLWVWLVFATFYGVVVHSGYHLPFTPTPEFHHYHHQKFNENFGVAGILDWLHGTDKTFRKSPAYSRNKVLFSFTPIR